MTKTIIFSTVIGYLFESVLLWYYCQSAFGSKFKRGFNFAVIVAVMTVCGAVNAVFSSKLFFVTIVNTVLDITCFALIIRFLYRQKLLNSFIHASIYFGMIAAGEYMIMPLLSFIYGGSLENLFTNDSFYFYLTCTSKILHLILMVIVLKLYLTFFIRGEEAAVSREKTKGLLFVLITPAFGLVMFTLTEMQYASLTLNLKQRVILTVVAVLMMASSFFAFYSHSNMVKQAQKISRFQIEKKQREFDVQYYELLTKTNQEMQILSHDFKNHLLQLDNAENMEQVHSYIQVLYPTIRQFNAATVSSNKTLNLIISKYNSLCAVKGIALSYSVESALDFLEAGDLTALLGNLLDNALEAAQNSEEKCMDLKLFEKNEKLVTCIITNSCAGAPQTKQGELLSTKAEGALHGIGLKSVQKTVEKYGGFYRWQYDEAARRFVTTVSFYVNCIAPHF